MDIDADGDIVGITDRAVDDGNLDRSDKSVGLNTSFPIKKIAFRPKGRYVLINRIFRICCNK